MIECPKCGEPIQKDDAFCGECGQAVVEVTTTSPVPAPQPTSPAIPPKPTSSPPKPAARPPAAPPSSPALRTEARWQAAGESRDNEFYTGQRLTYNGTTSTEIGFAGTTDSRALLVMFVRGLIIFFVTQIIGGIFLLAGFLLGGAAGVASGSVEAGGGVAVVFTGIAFVIGTAGVVLPFILPYRELLSDWCLTVEGKAAQAPDAFAMIYDKLQQRRLPVTMNVRRIQGMAEGGQANNYIICRSGRYFSYLSVLPFGTDLFMSWTLWRRLIPITFLFRMIGEFAGPVFGMDELRRTLATENAKAMREAVHNSMREGVEVATEGRHVDLQATFGFNIPIEQA